MEKNLKIKIVIASENDEYLFSNVKLDINTFPVKYDFDVEVIKNNKSGLPIVYNSALRRIRENKEKKYDYVLFMHSDVLFDIYSLLNKVDAYSSIYDIIGLCGCNKISYSVTPFNWFTGSKAFPLNRFGFVKHLDVNSETFYNSFDPALEHSNAICLDGLCLIFTQKSIYDSDIKFDESFKFDHYDSDLCFQACIVNKLRLGVIVENSLVHKSIGVSITKEDFKKSEEKFREKWDKILLKNETN